MSTVAETNRIYNITGTYDGKTMILYVDGNEVARNTEFEGDIPPPGYNTTSTIGANPAINVVHGQLADMKLHSARIYNRVLTLKEIENNVKATKKWIK